jgi:hypothetical protein
MESAAQAAEMHGVGSGGAAGMHGVESGWDRRRRQMEWNAMALQNIDDLIEGFDDDWGDEESSTDGNAQQCNTMQGAPSEEVLKTLLLKLGNQNAQKCLDEIVENKYSRL